MLRFTHTHTHVCICMYKKNSIWFWTNVRCAQCARVLFSFLFIFFLLFSHSVWISYGLLFYSIKCLVCCLNLSIVKWRQDNKKRQYTADFCIQPSTRFSKASESINSIKSTESWMGVERDRKRTCAIATATQ